MTTSDFTRMLAVISSLGISACGADGIGNAFSGGSSMRIDVEVYKGPLSKSVHIQWGELTALIREAETSLATFDDDVLRLASTQGFLRDAELPALKMDDWANRGARQLHQLQGMLAESGLVLGKLRRRLHGTYEDLDQSIAAVKTAEFAYRNVRSLVDEIVKLIDGNRSGLHAKWTSLKSSVATLADDVRDSARKIDALNLTNLPDGLVAGVSGEYLQNTAIDLKRAAARLQKMDSVFNVLAATDITDLGERLNVLANRDQYGPLSITPHHRGTIDNRRNTPSRTVSKVRGVEDQSNEERLFWCTSQHYRQAMDGQSEGVFHALAGQDCLRLAQIHDEVDHLLRIIRPFKELVQNRNNRFGYSLENAVSGIRNSELGGAVPVKLTEMLTWGSEIGTRMKHKAIYWAEAMMVNAPDRPVRTMATAFANMAAEIGNQISSRADTILKQCPEKPDGSRHCSDLISNRLPLSVYLREINPTEFHNLFTYNRSGGLASVEETFSRPAWSLGTEESADRARVVELLFSDHNWSNINTVYASGQGDVNMAFIKDSIGNWNLKNFKSDPTDLLEGYKRITVAAVDAAVKLVENASAPGAASSALSLASRMMKGRVGPAGKNTSGVDVERLSRAVARQINGIIDRGKQAETGMAADKISAHRQSVRDELLTLLSYHDKTLESLQAAVVSQDQADSTGSVAPTGAAISAGQGFAPAF